MTEEKKQRIRELAEAAFDATERYNRLAAVNPSGNLEERRQAFVELNLAKAEAVEVKNALDKEVGVFTEPPKSSTRPFEPLLNLNWLEDIFGAGRKK